MSLTRREFLRGLGGVLAAGVAPAFIGSDVLMPVKAYRPPPHKGLVVVLGHYSPGDGGGGTYYWESVWVAENGGTVIVPSPFVYAPEPVRVGRAWRASDSGGLVHDGTASVVVETMADARALLSRL